MSKFATGSDESPPAWPRRHPGAAIFLIVAIHLGFLTLFYQPAISGPDTNGYLAQARLIAREGTTGIELESPVQFVGSHWMRTAEGTYFGQYPPGLPALLSIPFRVFGPAVSLWTNIALASLTLLGVYLVGREWFGPGWGLLAALLMAFNPKANQHAVEADAHTAVAFFLVWGLLFLTRWDRSSRASWAAVAGVCVGMIPTIRYPEALFGLAFAGFIALAPRPIRQRLSGLIALVVGSMPPMLALFARNQAAFGAFWKTGYSVSGEQTAFSLANLARHFLPYLALLLVIGAALVAVAGALGAVTLARRAETRRIGLLLIGLVVPITLLYMAYYWSADSKSMRFLIPTFFLYALAAAGWMKLLAESNPARARRHVAILVATTALWGLGLSIFGLWQLRRDNATLAQITRAIRSAVPKGGIVIADDGVQQNLDFVGDWRLARAETILGERGGPPGMSPEPVVDDLDTPERRERTARFRESVAVWAASGGSPVFLVAGAEQIESLRQLLPATDNLRAVGNVTVETRGRGGPRPGVRRPGGPPRNPPGGGLLGSFLGPPPESPAPGGPRGPGGPGGPGGPQPPRPERFEPPSDGRLQIVSWTIGWEDQPESSKRKNDPQGG